MDIPEFEDLLGRLGDDLSTWPADRWDQATSLLRSSEEARAALAEAQSLRSALRSEPTPAPTGLIDRIMQKVRQSENAPADITVTGQND